jgi:hypothetical protein
VALRQTLLQGRSQSVEAAYYSVIASVRQQAAAEVRAGFGALTVAEEARLLATEVAADRIGIVLYPTRGRQILATGLPRAAQVADLPHPTRAALSAAAAGRPPGPALVATAGGRLVDCGGVAGLATPGTGTVLASVVAGLWAMGCASEGAAQLGAYLVAEAGRLLTERIGPYGFLASEVADAVPQALGRLVRGTE